MGIDQGMTQLTEIASASPDEEYLKAALLFGQSSRVGLKLPRRGDRTPAYTEQERFSEIPMMRAARVPVAVGVKVTATKQVAPGWTSTRTAVTRTTNRSATWLYSDNTSEKVKRLAHQKRRAGSGPPCAMGLGFARAEGVRFRSVLAMASECYTRRSDLQANAYADRRVELRGDSYL